MAAAAAAEAATGRSVLLHVVKCRRPYGIRTVDDCGYDGYDISKIFPIWGCIGDHEPNPNPDQPDAPRYPDGNSAENAWMILEPTEFPGGLLGFKLSQIFLGVPQSFMPTGRPGTCLIGSTLYEIGGSRSSAAQIRCLDIQNNNYSSWKPNGSLDFCFDRGGDKAVAVDEYVYLLGRIVERPGYYSSVRFAYVYNTNSREGYYTEGPPEIAGNSKFEFEAEVWAPLEGKGLLVSFPSIDGVGKFYLHNPYTRIWKSCDNYQPLPLWFTYGNCSVLNGILYFCDCAGHFIYAYNIKDGRFLYQVCLPELCINYWKLDHEPEYLFRPRGFAAVTESHFCLVSISIGLIFCASVSVSADEFGFYTAKVNGVQYFKEEVVKFLNAMPVDACLGQMAKTKTVVPLEEATTPLDDKKPSALHLALAL